MPMAKKYPGPPPAPEPPAHLSERAKALWRAVVPDRARSPGRLALVQTALEALDRADAAAAVIEQEGMLCETRVTGTKHVNPLLKVEKDNRQLFARLWSDLGLGTERS